MMIIFFKSLVLGALFTAYYWLFLRNKKIHVFNRYYITASMLAIVVLPFCQLDYKLSTAIKVAGLNDYLKNAREEFVPPVHQVSSLESYLAAGFLMVAVIMLFKFICKVVAVIKLKNRFQVTRVSGYNFVQTDLDSAPFTFFNNLFWRTDISLEEEPGRAILNHEIEHIKGRHSLDRVFSYFLSCLLWINPFLWILRKELLIVHEFLADSKSVKNGDTNLFARLILSSVKISPTVYPVSCFFGSAIKRRMTMIGKNNKPCYPAFRKFAIVPIGLMVITVLITGPGCTEKDISTSAPVSLARSSQTGDYGSMLREVSFINSNGEQKLLRTNIIFRNRANDPRHKTTNLDDFNIDIKTIKSDGTTKIIKHASIPKR